LSRLRPPRLAYIPPPRDVDGGPGCAPRPAEVCRDRRRQLEGFLGRRRPTALENDVRPGEPACVQPDVIRRRALERQKIIFVVGPAHEHGGAVCQDEPAWPGGRRWARARRAAAAESLASQLTPQVKQVITRGGLLDQG